MNPRLPPVLVLSRRAIVVHAPGCCQTHSGAFCNAATHASRTACPAPSRRVYCARREADLRRRGLLERTWETSRQTRSKHAKRPNSSPPAREWRRALTGQAEQANLLPAAEMLADTAKGDGQCHAWDDMLGTDYGSQYEAAPWGRVRPGHSLYGVPERTRAEVIRLCERKALRQSRCTGE